MHPIMNTNNTKISLETIGYSVFFENNRRSSLDPNLIPARIIAEHKERYILRNETSELSATITGKMMFTAASREDYPAVGDWVLIAVLDNNQAVIKEILPRKTILKRKYAGKSDSQLIAANIDAAFIVQSPDRDFNLNRLERYVTVARSAHIKPIIILNKTDLLSDAEMDEKVSEITNRFIAIDVYPAAPLAVKELMLLLIALNRDVPIVFWVLPGLGNHRL